MTSLRVLIGNAPSFRSILRGEIQHVLGKAKVKELPGGFVVNSAPEGLWRMAHSLRTAEFLRVVVGRGKASSNDELEKTVKSIPWHVYFPRWRPQLPFNEKQTHIPRVVVRTESSKLLNNRNLKSSIEKWIGESLAVPSDKLDSLRRREAQTLGEKGEDSRGDPRALVHMRLVKGEAELQVNACGDRLHRRGWRIETAEAPIRETLAAGCLRAAALEVARLDGILHQNAPSTVEHTEQALRHLLRFGLWDPFCGSGTFVLEAVDALLGLAPVLPRGFAFEDWPVHDKNAYDQILNLLREENKRLQEARKPFAHGIPPFFGSDIKERALNSARSNAKRLHPLAVRATNFLQGDVGDMVEKAGRGVCIFANVPYGHRVKAGEKFSALFHRWKADGNLDSKVQEWWTRHAGDVKLKSFDKILVPVHMTNHWFLYEMDVKSKEIRVVDSIAKAGIGEKQEEHIEVLQEFAALHDAESSGASQTTWTAKVLRPSEVSQQGNSSDCGVFMLKFIQLICRGYEAPFIASGKEIAELRSSLKTDATAALRSGTGHL